MLAITYQSPMKRGTSTCGITGSGGAAVRQAQSRRAVMTMEAAARVPSGTHFIAHRAPIGRGLQRQPLPVRRVPQLDRVLAARERVVLGRHAARADLEALLACVADA